MAQKLLYLAAILRLIAREWGRIGCLGFGGPPAHIAMLRRLSLARGWLTEEEFEHAVATCNLLPGPASTQLAIYCAWRVAGPAGALVGGVAFIAPGLLAVLALASVFLAPHPPRWVLGAGAGAGATIAAVAVRAGLGLAPSSPARSRTGARRVRWAIYAGLGALAAALLGAWLVLVLLGCGLLELTLRRGSLTTLGVASIVNPRPTLRGGASVLHWARPSLTLAAIGVGTGGLGALAWMSLKVGALSYGGGFVIVPLMRADAVHVYHWMTASQFLDAVALGQITPGPVTHTVAVVGYAAHGLGGGLFAALVAFTPSFAFVLLGARHFEGLRGDPRARAFLDGAGPAAIGAIVGSAVPLALSLTEGWQVAVLGGAAVALFGLRRSVPFTILAAALAGSVVVLAGAPVPH
jgi:chromate transporter